jgi:hypothetical protein
MRDPMGKKGIPELIGLLGFWTTGLAELLLELPWTRVSYMHICTQTANTGGWGGLFHDCVVYVMR